MSTRVRQFQVDAFAERVFTGNPAAVVPLERWPDDAMLQAIAEENNLSETAFLVGDRDRYQLRWFTPTQEVDLCGHATLAAAHVLFEHLRSVSPRLTFATRSGELAVRRLVQGIELDLPACRPSPCAVPDVLVRALGRRPLETLAGNDYIAVVGNEAEVRTLRPDLALLLELDLDGLIVTAPGAGTDFVSRYFAPKVGIPEDPVTGTAHCQLAPLWADRLGKRTLIAHQVSRRGGRIGCQLAGDRVLLTGTAVTFMEADLLLPTGSSSH